MRFTSGNVQNEFKPYVGTTLNAPIFHMILQPLLPVLQPLLTAFFKLRWMLSRPMELRVLPSWIPVVHLPGIKTLPYVTVGEILLLLPLLVLMFAGYNLSFVAPHIADSGTMSAYAIYATFLTANKANSLFAFLLGIPFERMIPYHRCASVVAVVLGIFHTYVSFVRYGQGTHSKIGKDPNLPAFLFELKVNATGSILLASLTALVVTSLFPIIRRHFFDIWLWGHVLLTIAVIIFCILHSIKAVLFVTVWWAVDVSIRYIVMAGCKYHVKANLQALRNDIVEVTFLKPPGFHYKPGQFVQMAVPALSLLEFHPISISSAPHRDYMTLHVRGLGGWTKKLFTLAQEKAVLDIAFEGPYGSLSIDMDDDDRFKMVLLVSGGIGVTHCQSVGTALIHESKMGRQLKYLRFIWAVRHLDMVEDIPPLGTVNGRSVMPSSYTAGCQVDFAQDTTNGVVESSLSSSLRQVIQTDIYCSNSTPEDVLSSEGNYNLYPNRFDLDQVFEEMKLRAIQQGEYNVAVFGCGPANLMESLQEACRKHSQSVMGCGGVFFDLHMETFEF